MVSMFIEAVIKHRMGNQRVRPNAIYFVGSGSLAVGVTCHLPRATDHERAGSQFVTAPHASSTI